MLKTIKPITDVVSVMTTYAAITLTSLPIRTVEQDL